MFAFAGFLNVILLSCLGFSLWCHVGGRGGGWRGAVEWGRRGKWQTEAVGVKSKERRGDGEGRVTFGRAFG